MQTRDLVAALADGQGWSGSELARRFGVTRAAVWKRLDELREQRRQAHVLHGEAVAARVQAERLREIALARAARSGDQRRLVSCDPAVLRELEHLSLAQAARRAVVDVLDRRFALFDDALALLLLRFHQTELA